MKQQEIFKNLLNLSISENTVFLFLLERRRAKVTDIVKTIQVPRSTVIDTLNKLQKRRLVRPVEVNGRSEWKLSNQSNLVEKFLNVAELLQTNEFAKQSPKKSLQLKLSKQTEFVIYIGVQNILNIYLREFSSRKNERVQGLQTTQSGRQALEKASHQRFIAINNAIKDNKIIMEMVMSYSMLETFDGNEKEWLKSLHGRTAATTLVADNLLDFSAELIIFNDKLLITNWEDEVLIVVKNKNIINMIKTLLKLLHSSGKTLDYNQYLTDMIK